MYSRTIDLNDYISEIVCGKDYGLTYVMNSGEEVKTIWHPYSRKDSWNEEMRQQARNRTLERSRLSVENSPKKQWRSKTVLCVELA